MSRQRLGQHFLRSSGTLRRIADALLASPDDLILEIGPGRGALTRVLLDDGLRVEAIELDSALVKHLRETWPPETTRFRVHEGDVLDTDLSQWGPVIVAGNLPYYITSPILRKLFDMKGILRRAVLLMQREVAERVVAKPGTRDYGFLSVLTQCQTTPEILFRVPPGAFHVSPKVESAVIRLEPSNHGQFGIPDEDWQRFVTFLGWCFEQKRKTLRNNLRPHVRQDVLERQPEITQRAEQLSLSEFASLFRRIQAGASTAQTTAR